MHSPLYTLILPKVGSTPKWYFHKWPGNNNPSLNGKIRSCVNKDQNWALNRKPGQWNETQMERKAESMTAPIRVLES